MYGKINSRLASARVLLFLSLMAIETGAEAQVHAHAHDVWSLAISRRDRIVFVLNVKNEIVARFPCGIGRGGLKQKTSMQDEVTPVGTFVVDLILSAVADFNDISSALREKYERSPFTRFVRRKEDLKGLFSRMNAMDFDRDGKPHSAYGTAYIGLDAAGKGTVTGPKMITKHGAPYWYSIAIHGTPHPRHIGRSESGGCIHLSDEALAWLIGNGIVKVGTKVVIDDSKPEE